MLNDEELISNYKNGDHNAFNLLLKKYNDLLSKFANRFSANNSLLKNEYDDLYQEATLAFLYAINNYDLNKDASFKTFLYICISGRINKYLKKFYKYKDEFLSLDEEIDNKLLSRKQENNNPEEFINYSLIKNNLIDYKAKLNNLDSMIFELYLNNFNNKEIAKLLNIKYKKVDNTLYLIKKSMKR